MARTDSLVCPYLALTAYMKIAKLSVKSTGYLFRQIVTAPNGQSKIKGNCHLSYIRCRELFLGALTLIGLDCSRFGLHSLRSGGTTAAAQKNLPLRQIKQHGGWSSDSSLSRYIADSAEQRLMVSKKLGT